MKYITHHSFKGIALCGKQLNIPYGTELEVSGNCLLTPEGNSVCYYTSANAKRHFALNDDGHGLERGALTYAISYSERQRKCENGAYYRFSDKERAMLIRDWSHFLRPDSDFILFNEAFFRAEIEELQKLAKALNIRVRR